MINLRSMLTYMEIMNFFKNEIKLGFRYRVIQEVNFPPLY